MSAIAVERLLTSPAHHVTALIFYNITWCYGKHMAVFAVAEAGGDIIKYQLFVYGSFVWGIHVRYNNHNTPHFLKRRDMKSIRKYVSKQHKNRKCIFSICQELVGIQGLNKKE